MEEASTSGGQSTLCGRGRRRRGETASGGRCAPRAPSSYAYILLHLLPSPLRRQSLRADRADGIRALLHADPPPPPSAARAYGRILHLRRRRLLLRRPASIHHALAPPSATPAAPCVHPRRPRLLLRLALVSSCGVLRFELGRQDRNLINVRGPLRPRAVTVLTPGSCDASARPTWCSLPINVAPPPPSSRTSVWLGRRHLRGRHTCAQRLIILQSRDHKGEREVYDAWEQYLGMEHTDTAPKWSIQ
jgi:hypothetical protein